MMTLPDPVFIDADPDRITAELVAKYEQRTGKTLQPAQIERLFIDLIAYAKSMTHVGINEAGKQMLARFSGSPILEYLGEFVQVDRLPESSARTTLRFAIAASRMTDLAIPRGTLVESGDGKVTFGTDAAAVITAGKLSVDVAATCTTPGIVGNDWQPGQISVLASDLGNVTVTVSNTVKTDHGAEAEDVERYRTRVLEGPEKFSVAGPRAAYRAHAMAAHKDIIDVGVVKPEMALVNGNLVSTNHVPPGAVYLYPLLATGAADVPILTLVEAALSDEKKRPLCDFVKAFPAQPVDYSLDIGLVLLDTSADTSTPLDTSIPIALARKAAEARAAWLQAGNGRDVVVNDFIERIKAIGGIYDLAIPSLPANLTVEDWQFARCLAVNVTVTGVKRG